MQIYSLSLWMLILLGPFHHFPSLHAGLNANTSKYNPYSSPLAYCQRVVEYNYTQEHGKQFPSYSDHDQCQRAKVLYSLEYEQLA